jgi:hypothetical protein
LNFIFPSNYSFKNKLLGIIDYPTAIFNVIYFLIIFGINYLLFSSINIRIIFIVVFYFPIFLFSIVGFNHENILYSLFYILKFLIKPKIYLYF